MSKSMGIIAGAQALHRRMRAYPNASLAFWATASNLIPIALLAGVRSGLELLPHPVPPTLHGIASGVFIAAIWVLAAWMFIAGVAWPFVTAFACWRAFHDRQTRKLMQARNNDSTATRPMEVSDSAPHPT
ncbi:MAG TPA: hypothetical protein VGM05_03655 [Planctomycetaceae bacterium]|jgi:hypothetical protein